MTRTELGCPGHFIAVRSCQFRRHTQVPGYRISTVGDYYDHEDKRQTIGAGPDTYFETLVFRTTGKSADDNDGCGCEEVVKWCEIDGRRWATAGEAQRGHEEHVEKYLKGGIR